MAGKTTNMKQNWKILLKGVDMGEQTSFLDDGQHSRSCSLGFGDGSISFRTESLFGSSHFAQTGCNTVSRSVSLHDVVLCLAKDGLLSKLPQDGSESFVGRVQRRCSGQGSGGLRLRAQKPQVQRRWQRGQGTHARRCRGWRAPSTFWVTANQQKPGGWGQHFQVEECQGFIQRSQSSDSDGAGAGSRTEGVGRRSGAVDQIARKDDESMFTRAHAAWPPRQCSQIQHWQKFTSCGLESPRWRRREKSSA